MNHTYTIEHIYIFICEVCDKWWSIGDWEPDAVKMCCPDCGTIAIIVELGRKMECEDDPSPAQQTTVDEDAHNALHRT